MEEADFTSGSLSDPPPFEQRPVYIEPQTTNQIWTASGHNKDLLDKIKKKLKLIFLIF